MKRARSGFTLIEALISVALSTIVLGALIFMLVKLAMAWRDAMAQWMLATSSRIAREKILRGVGDQYGVRAASLGSLVIQAGSDPGVEQLDFQEGGVACRIRTDPAATYSGKTLVGSRLAGTASTMILPGVSADQLAFRLDGRELTCNLRLTVTTGGLVFTQDQEIVCHVLND
jgi:hypothetical protein